MANYLVTDAQLQAIANKIRQKTGSSAAIQFYSAFVSEIEKLTDGGGVLLITISEGRNRQVRKMCEQAGLRVTRLCRISEGGLKLGTLKSGTWRELTRAEIARLKRTEQENENI